MLEWKVEARKHIQFFGFSLLIICSILAAYLIIDNTVTDVLWVFGVILISCATVAYSAAHIFTHLALGSDLLFHMSTQAAAKKFVLKTVPLLTGTTLIGFVTVSGYLTQADNITDSLSPYIYAYGSKAASIGAFIALVWVLARVVTNLRNASMKMLTFGTLLTAFIGLQIYGHWSVHPLSGETWSVGGTTDFLGLPMYVNVLAINVTDPHTPITSPMYGSLLVNLATILLGVVTELLLFSRKNAHRSITKLGMAS